jgi:hypothetical protein
MGEYGLRMATWRDAGIQSRAAVAQILYDLDDGLASTRKTDKP